MAKKKGGGSEGSLFPEVGKITSLLRSEAKQELVILVIPSHDNRNRELGVVVMTQWASNALELFADLYRGATAFKTFKGVFKTDDGQYLFDEPILIESYASTDAIEDTTRLNALVHFAKRLGRETRQ